MPFYRKQRPLHFGRTAFILTAVVAALSACGPGAEPLAEETAEIVDSANECVGSGGYGFVCGPQNAEDLVVVPGTPWIIASGMAQGAAIYLVHSEQKTWTNLYPADRARAEQDMTTYASCPGAPDPENFITHGLNLRTDEDENSTLYVVSHGAREAIEVFEVDAGGERPELTWTGCVMMPETLAANSVASFSDGSLVATVLLHPGRTFNDVMAGEPTGAVYEWSPGDDGFKVVEGTQLPGNNGIEVSADEGELFVVSSGLRTVVAYERSNPSRQLRTTRVMAFTPDNVHMGPDGRLTTAGMLFEEPACDEALDPTEFNIETFAACPRGFIAAAIDPDTVQDVDLAQGAANPEFSNATMALRAGNEVWIGTFSGDRIGYRSLEGSD